MEDWIEHEGARYYSFECLHAEIQVAERRGDKIVSLRLRVRELEKFAKDVRDNYDCDADAHKHGTPCRKCEAEKVLFPRS